MKYKKGGCLKKGALRTLKCILGGFKSTFLVFSFVVLGILD